MYEHISLLVEILILLAVVWEGWISHKHYKLSFAKKEKAEAKRKAKRLIRRVLK